MENTATRKLASIQVIDTISPIVGGDRIVLATLKDLGWQCCIGKKDNIAVGDKVVYFEVDSILPDKPEYEFLRSVKFRIKTRKFLSQTSQGLILPITDNLKNLDIGTDVTTILGVVKYDPQAQEEEEAALSIPKHRSKVVQYLMQFKAFRYIYLKLNSQTKGNWPSHICSQTDETPIQRYIKNFMNHYNEDWYVGEKLEGCSFSCFTHKVRIWGFLKKQFGVCSRTIWLKTQNNSNYWQIAKKYDLKNKLIKYSKNIVIQGEIIGNKIQGNLYKRDLDMYVFNVIIDVAQLTLDEALTFCKDNELNFVPILIPTFNPSKEIGAEKEIKDIIEWLTKFSNGKTVMLDKAGNILDIKREGVVIRLKSNPRISFKIRSPEYLIEHGE